MIEQLPFQLRMISCTEPDDFAEGSIISAVDKCGIYICTQGGVQVSVDGKTFGVNRGDIYIYMSGTLVRLLRRSDEAEGVMMTVDVGYILPIINKVMSAENMLFIREHPCISLTSAQSDYLFSLLRNLYDAWEGAKKRASATAGSIC